MNPYTTTYIPRDDGTLDVFIIGPDGVPVAKLENPVASGEEAEPYVREKMAELRGLETVGYEEPRILDAAARLWFWVRRLYSRSHSSPIP